MKNILITGGAGFIGSNFITYFIELHKDHKIINLDKLTYAADLNNLQEIKNHPNYKFIEGDICNKSLIEDIFTKYNIDSVIHFAAESHVDNSITGPENFVNTNIIGTFNLLDVAYKSWMVSPHKYKENFEHSRFHHISTDEVYGSLGEDGLFSEQTPYAPNSPYSASKASSDFLVRSYFHTFGLNVVTSNCSNNYGPKQHSEKLIPTIIRKCLANENIPIYGNGKNIRDWLYVLDHCKAIDLIFHQGKLGETYNIGGHNEKNNLEVTYKICEILDQLQPRKTGKYQELITFVSDRPGHDQRYAIDSTKLQKDLNWQADENFDTGIVKTVKWYLNLK
jgi:dTDP-glucose 4,6-dehydratase